MQVVAFTDLDGARRQREVIARMREQEALPSHPLAKEGKRTGVNTHDRHDHFEAHKIEIIKDYLKHGRAFLRKKWSISETAFDGLMRRRWANDIKRLRPKRHQEQG